MTITRREFRNVLGLGVACWLVGVICAGAVGYFYTERATQLVENSHNPLVCVFHKYVSQSRARSDFVAKHGPTAQARATARQARDSADDVLAHLITLPPGRNCARILKP